MDKKLQTISTYNKSAKVLADKFDNLGVRVADIEEAFKLVNIKNPKVIEIGCGNGRDAKEILKYTDDYLGIDISSELIKLAREKNPNGKFEVADVEEFVFPQNINIVFAFASLLHVDKIEFKKILDNIYQALSPLGIVRISLKASEKYEEITQEDEFGIRTFYLYSREDIKELAKDFIILKNEIKDRRVKWLEIILQKK